MSKLLIDDYPIQVLPKLAERIGLNESIILKQVQLQASRRMHNFDGKLWVCNSISDWVEQFPFWSESTIKRIIKSLEKQNLLLVGNYNEHKFDRTKWYAVNYSAIELLED